MHQCLPFLLKKSLKRTGSKHIDLEAIAVSKGPGSYTGLRIGVSVAKGIAYAASIPLIGIETTLSMFWGYSETWKNRPGNMTRLPYSARCLMPGEWKSIMQYMI